MMLRPLGVSLDTVEALGAGELRVDVARLLASLWGAVYEGEALKAIPIATNSGEQLGPSLDVRVASRTSAYPVMFVGPLWRLFVCPKRGTAKLIIGAEYLARSALSDVRIEMERIASWLWSRGGWKLSRLDLACDVDGLPVAQCAQLDSVVCSSSVVKTLESSDDEAVEPTNPTVIERHRRVQTVMFGSASSRIQVCAYDKVAECRHSGKEWVLDLARSKGWAPCRPLTRIEFRFRQRALDEFPEARLRALDALDRFDEWAPGLWKYATHACVRYVDTATRDSNRARWRTLPWWSEIQAATRDEQRAERVRIVSASVVEERRKRASRDVMRGAMGLVAENPAAAHRVARALARIAHGETLDHAPEIFIVVEALALSGPLLGARILKEAQECERAAHWRGELERRLEWIAWSDDPARAMYRYERPHLGFAA